MSETYIVKSGDTLSVIASKYNVSGGYMALAKYNNISNPNIINVGQKIVIPDGTTSASSTKPSSSSGSSSTSGNTQTQSQSSTTRSSLASSSVDFGEKNSNARKNKISKLTIHHMAGDMGAQSCANMHKNGSASANYYIGSDGSICAGVAENRRAWTSSSGDNDHQAITFEVANSKGAPNWEVSDAAYKATINLCRDICSRYGISPHYDGSAGGSLTEHRMFSSTLCPGPYLHNKLKNGEVEKDITNGVSSDPKISDPKPGNDNNNNNNNNNSGSNTQTVGVGSTVRITGTKYATGQTIPNWVKQNNYTVQQISGNRALIKEIISWVNISDLKLISGGTTTTNTNSNSNSNSSAPKTDNNAVNNDNESIVLDVQLKSQKTDHTCGSASGAMAASTYANANITENDIWNDADGQGTYVYRIKDQINTHISKHGKGNDYAYTTTSNTSGNFLKMITASLKLGAPVILRVQPSTDVYGYKTDGHYVVVSGIYKKDGETKLRITDPWSSKWYSEKTGQIFDQSSNKIQNTLKGGSTGDGYLILHKNAKV